MKRILAAAALALPFCLPQAVQALELRLGGVHSPLSAETLALNHFAEQVAERSNGEMTIRVFPASQLGDAIGMIENVMVGAQDMFANSADWNQTLISDYAVMSMPFTFADIDHVKRYLESDIHAATKERLLEERGIRVLAENFYRLPRVLVTRDPIDSVESLQGKTLRMADVETQVRTWRAMGATTTIIPWAESYLALRTGVVDGMDSPLSSVYSENFYQAASHVTLTNHGISPFNILMSERRYQSMTEEQQQVLVEAAHAAGDYYTAMIAEEFAEQQAKMEAEGTVFSEVDLEPFQARALEIARDFEARGVWPEGLFERVQGL